MPVSCLWSDKGCDRWSLCSNIGRASSRRLLMELSGDTRWTINLWGTSSFVFTRKEGSHPETHERHEKRYHYHSQMNTHVETSFNDRRPTLTFRQQSCPSQLSLKWCSHGNMRLHVKLIYTSSLFEKSIGLQSCRHFGYLFDRAVVMINEVDYWADDRTSFAAKLL